MCFEASCPYILYSWRSNVGLGHNLPITTRHKRKRENVKKISQHVSVFWIVISYNSMISSILIKYHHPTLRMDNWLHAKLYCMYVILYFIIQFRFSQIKKPGVYFSSTSKFSYIALAFFVLAFSHNLHRQIEFAKPTGT